MTTSVRTAEPVRSPLPPARKTSLVAGGLYLLTFASSIAAVLLLRPVLDDPGYIAGAGADTRVLAGGLLDVVNALACIGTAVALFSVLKRQHEGFALGFVTTRVLEAAVIMAGVVSLLSVVTLRQNLAGTAGGDEASFVAVGQALVAIRDWTFLLGPNLMAALNALLLATLMYRSGLVPRVIAMAGLIGGPLLLADTVAILLGSHDLGSVWHLIAVAPIFCWELALGVWLVVKGFRRSPITTTPTGAHGDQ